MTKGIEAGDIQDLAIQDLAETLAERLGVAPEVAMRRALRNELLRTERGSLRERLQPLFASTDKRPRGPEADKTFYDTLNGE